MSENTLLFPQDYSLDSILVVTSLGQTLDLRHVMQGLIYYEDLYSNCITGQIIINDGTGYISMYNFCGMEYLTLAFSKPGIENSQVKKTFRVFKIDNRKMVNEQNENYVIHFCSEENVISEQYKVSKSYKNKKIHEMVEDIVYNKLKVLPEKFDTVNIEKTKNLRDIIVPNLKPFEAINWLCTHAISENPKTLGSPYLFYENFFGYNFKSLQSLFDSEVYGEYKYEPKNVTTSEDRRVIDLQASRNNILSYEPVSVFDTLNMINSGGYANRMITIDPLRLTFDEVNFDYKKYFENAKKLNEFDLLPIAENRFNRTANTTYDSMLKMVTTNTGQTTYNQYIKTNDPSVRDIEIEKTIPFRAAQLAHINYHRYKLLLSGDPKMTVGSVITVNIPDLAILPEGKPLDKFYSGKYLVTAVKHSIDVDNRFMTLVEVSKESVPTKYVDFDNTLPGWKLIRGR
jgi:hypothetical protein